MYLNKIKILHEHEFKFTLILSTAPHTFLSKKIIGEER